MAEILTKGNAERDIGKEGRTGLKSG